MTTAYVTANPATASGVQVLFTTPKHEKGRIKSLIVNNFGGASNHVITLQDVFLPDASNGVASPTSTTLYLLSYPVPISGSLILTDDDLRDKDTLGVVSAYADAQDSGCQIYVGYHFSHGGYGNKG